MQKSILNAEFYNQMLDKKGTKKILSWFLDNYGPTRTSQFLEELKSVGFHFATQAGISLGFDDLKVPLKKSFILQNAEVDLQKYENRFQQGRMTAVERYQKVIDIWTTASENLKDEVIQNFQNTDLFNPLYMMAFSGARGNISQVRQLVGMRGLMSDSAGGIIDFPIRSNFREGLTVTEYVISCYGARKGLIDTALRTADSGYLTRRLVDVAHGIMIGRIECGTDENFVMYPLKTAGKSGAESIVLSLEKRIQGRILAQDIEKIESNAEWTLRKADPVRFENIHTRTQILAHKNQEITPLLAAEIAQHQTQLALFDIEYEKNRVWNHSKVELNMKKDSRSQNLNYMSLGQGELQYESLLIRSPFTCQHFQNAREDICQLCYGWSLAHGRLVSLGEAVGVLAAQSIGEPGTQLTMRTFHTGGIFSTDIDAKIFAPHDGIIHFGVAEGRGLHQYQAMKVLGVPSIRASKGGGENFRSPDSSKAPRGKKIRTFHGETAFFLFEPVQCKIEEANSLRVSVFFLPAQSLVFVYPGQKVLKNTLCAEISHLLNARTNTSPRNIRREESHSHDSRPANLQSSVFIEDQTQKKGDDTSSRRQTAWTELLHMPKEIKIELPVGEASAEALESSNTKKVLSEIEGQVYFHRLAERRQTTEFENMSHVKGVGSLWILNGKAAQMNGHLRSGDFYQETSLASNCKFSIEPYKSYAAENSRFEIRRFRPSNTRIHEITSSQLFPRSEDQRFKINGNDWIPAISFVSYWQNADIHKFEVSLREAVSGKNWLQLQKKKLLPEGALFAFSLVQNRIRKSQKFQNLFTNWQKLSSSLRGSQKPYNSRFNSEMVVSGESASETENCKIFRIFSISGNRPHLAVEYTDFQGESVAPSRTPDSQAIRTISPDPDRASPIRVSSNRVNFLGELRSVQGQRPQANFRHSANSFNQKSLLLQKSHLRRLEISAREINLSALNRTSPVLGDGLNSRLGKSNLESRFSKFNSSLPNSISKEAYSENESASNSKVYKKIGEFIKNAESFSLSEVGTHLDHTFGIGKTQVEPSELNTKLAQGPTLDKTVHIVSRMTNKYAGASLHRARAIGGPTIDVKSKSLNNVFASAPLIQIQQSKKKLAPWNLCFTLRRIHPYLISNDSGLAVRHGDIVSARQFLFELFFEKSKTGDIVQGLPKIEQLFEARRTSLHVMETIHLKLKSKFTELCKEYPLYEATRQSIRFIQRVLLDEIQMVYQSQGVDIADKHLEIIIRQMTSKVIIQEKGQSPFFPDDIIDFYQLQGFAEHSMDKPPVSQGVQKSYNQETRFEPIVLGITKRSFFTESFVSAASFQEAKRVLMHCALQSKVDFLYGLKENVILGRFIRAGTGFRTSVFPTLS